MYSKMHSQKYAFKNAQYEKNVPHLVEVLAGMIDMRSKAHKQRYAFQNTQSKICNPKYTI